MSDQQDFAMLSGDWNPVHVDPVFARRTVAGKPIVHGIHLLVRALEFAATQGHAGDPVASLKAKFSGFVATGDDVEIVVAPARDGMLRLNVVSGGRVKAVFTAGYGRTSPVDRAPSEHEPRFEPGREAMVCEPDRISGMTGVVPSATAAAAWQERFPKAAHWLGADRLAALGASTRLVGMVCPGLHSLYVGLRLKFREGADTDGSLSFRMGECRHGLVNAYVAGGRIEGELDCVVRAAPPGQRAMADLAGLVAPDAFARQDVLVVGGSRGLGEVSAKLLALGGARVTITYAAGARDAERVVEQIGSAGGSCAAMEYRLGDDMAALLDRLATPPGHAYYFATPRIAANDGEFFDADRYAELQAFFIDGFWALTSALRARRKDARLFYPSTTYIDERPKEFGEYAMAKAAGEMLCAEINRFLSPLTVVVARLPQLATDQGLTSSRVLGADPAAALLPILKEVQGATS